MKSIKNVTCLILMFIAVQMSAQEKKFLKVSFTAYPISTIDTPPENSNLFQYHSGTVSLAQSYQFKYSLLIDLEKNQSIYKLDTLVRQNIPAGKEKVRFMINNNLSYVVKENKNKYFKYEEIFKKDFYSDGDIKDIEWEITNEEKVISGMKCKKAVSKKKEFYITVWFTEDIPVSSGPANFFGLPGLVVWSEDFSWTTELVNVEYVNEYNFEAELNSFRNKFDENKKNKEIKESLLLIKKAELVESMIDNMKKP